MVPPRSDRISRVPPYSRMMVRRSRTGLSPTSAGLSSPFRFALHHHWPDPRSLATTNGVSIDFLSSGYLDVSVLPVRLLYLCIQYRISPKGWVSPFGHAWIKSCLPAPHAFSQATTSFIASDCQGIHRARLVTWPYKLSNLVFLHLFAFEKASTCNAPDKRLRFRLSFYRLSPHC